MTGFMRMMTSLPAWRPRYDGPLDFIFVVHPRDYADQIRPWPEMRLLPRSLVSEICSKPSIGIIAGMEAQLDGRALHGELIAIPFQPLDMLTRLTEARAAMLAVLDYAGSRSTRMMGLGALLPSITRYGSLLTKQSNGVGVTTGHTFTALAIADYVRRIENLRGKVGPVAVIGAAGCTGRAATRCLLRDGHPRRLILVDLPERLGIIAKTGLLDERLHKVTAQRQDIRQASIVVCVTNAPGAILGPDDFAPGCVILDDAQPENVGCEVLRQRPDLIVVKCLARVPRLTCPCNFGLFAEGATPLRQELTFTCLAETVMLAAAGHKGHFTIQNPHDDQFNLLEKVSAHYGIGTAPFHSYPHLGPVELAVGPSQAR